MIPRPIPRPVREKALLRIKLLGGSTLLQGRACDEPGAVYQLIHLVKIGGEVRFMESAHAQMNDLGSRMAGVIAYGYKSWDFSVDQCFFR